MDPKPGWKTSEFWMTIVKSLIATLTIGGFVTVADSSKLDAAITAIVSAVFVFIANAYVISSYIKSRVTLKTDNDNQKPDNQKPDNNPPQVLSI